MARITIGGRRVLIATSCLVPDGEDVLLNFKDHDGEDLAIRLEIRASVVEKDSKEKPKASISINDVDGMPVIRFLDWNSALGNSTKRPIVFATGTNVELSFLASVARLGTLYRVEFQALVEVKQ